MKKRDKFGFVVITLALILLSAAGCTGPRDVAGNPLALATSKEVTASELVVLTGKPSRYSLSSFDLETGKVEWSTELEGVDFPHTLNVTFDEARVYAISGKRLLALSRTVGTPLWEMTFEDPYDPFCRRCIAALAERVILQTGAGLIYGLDAATGAVVWRTEQTRLQHQELGFFVPEGSAPEFIAFADLTGTDASAPGVLRVVKAEDGSEIQEIAASCSPQSREETPGPGALLHFDSQHEILYTLYSAFPGFTCAQAWDIAQNTPLWQTVLSRKDVADPLFLGVGRAPLLVHRDKVYIGCENTGHTALTEIDLAGGAFRSFTEDLARGLDKDPESAFSRVIPVDKHENLLAAYVKPDGEQTFEIWGIDVANTEKLWAYPTQVAAESNLALPGDFSVSQDVAVLATRYGVFVLEAREEPRAASTRRWLQMSLLDNATGAPVYSADKYLEFVDLKGIPVQIGDEVYFAADIGLYRYELTSGDYRRVLGSETPGGD